MPRAPQRPLAASMPATVAILVALAACTQPAACTDVSFTQQVLLPAVDFADTAGLRVADLDGDGHDEVLASSPLHGTVHILRQCPECRPFNLTGFMSPVRTQVVDLDQDGLRDVLVADIGILYPSDVMEGRVVWLKAVSPWVFERHTLLERVGRVSCAEAADLDGDLDLDIAVCIFGNIAGSLSWLENTGTEGGRPAFSRHVIEATPGTIHAFPVDLDGDGDLDLATSMAQLAEEVAAWINDGKGSFSKRLLASGGVTYYGMSGIEVTDLDQDGDPDIIALHGDVYDFDTPPHVDPMTFYGAFWLENDGEASFTRHELVEGWGLYAARAADLDGDGDLDVVMGALQMARNFPDKHTASLLWLENDGRERFERHDIPGSIPQVVPVELADLDGDGRMEILAGSHFPDQSPGGHLVVRVVPTVSPCAT